MAIFKQILTKEQAKIINEWLDEDQDGWSKKAVTGPSNPSIKHCQEYSGKYLEKIQRNIFESLDKSSSWLSYTVYPKQSSEIIINRYKEGNFYREHLDTNHNSPLGAFHYSNTLFISDPKNYEGGELVLVKDEEEISYKLNPGDLIAYPTGTPHRVENVKKGIRYSIVFWTESYITNVYDRDKIRLLYKSYKQLSDLVHGLPPHKMDQASTLYRTMSSVEEAIISKYHVQRQQKNDES